jgi:hypothetical protein
LDTHNKLFCVVENPFHFFKTPLAIQFTPEKFEAFGKVSAFYSILLSCIPFFQRTLQPVGCDIFFQVSGLFCFYSRVEDDFSPGIKYSPF